MEETTVERPAPPETPAVVGRPSRLWIGGGVVAACIIGAWYLAPHRVAEPDRPPGFAVDGEKVAIDGGAAAWTYVDLAQAAVGNPLPPKPVPGRIAVDEARSEQVLAPLSGRVETVSARLGQQLEKGDPLVSVRSTALVDLSKEIDQLTREEGAKAQVVQRLRSLVGVRAVPEKDLVAAEQELGQAQLAKQAAQLKLKSLAVASGSDALYWLTAQRSGVVVERNVLPGQEVGPERGEPLFVIADLDEVVVAADVPESDVGELRLGQDAEVTSAALADQPQSGKVEYISQVVDPQRRMVNVRVRVPNARRILRPNGFVQVAFAPVGAPRVVIPAEAVVTDDQDSVVFVRAGPEGAPLERRAVVPGRQRAGEVEITSGLVPGETYVKRGAILLLNAVDLARQ